MLSYFLSLSRRQKRFISIFVDTIFLFSAFSLAFLARFESLTPLRNADVWFVFAVVLPTTLYGFVKLGLYRAVLRYINIQAMWAVLFGCILSFSTLVAVAFFFHIQIPRSVPFIFFALALLGIGGSRLIIRSLIGVHNIYKKDAVVIYGAGSAGMQLATALNQGPEYYVSAFIDDDVTKQNHTIQGIRVYPPSALPRLINKKVISSVLLALPSTSRARRKEVLSKLEYLPVKVMTMPGMADIVEGHASYDQVNEVAIEDLLGRDPVSPREELMSANIRDKVVMVTGAGGSIGSELCRQIVNQSPKKLVLFEISEYSLYAIEKELNAKKTDGLEIIPIMGSVQKQALLESVMKSFKVDTIYHAAAYKHVPLVEHNVIEGVQNNVYGTLNTAQAAINSNVDSFVLISTDKAVRPTNVMGTTKRMAELVLQALASHQSITRFSMVRFGNVLGSSGSVVPLFRKQIKEGGPITLTHMDITRYFMTIPEASQLVIQAGAMGKGGDVFVLDMGESVKIYDLAVKMVHLSGYQVKDKEHPSGDIEIKCTGLRPGEKLYEELLIGDNVYGTDHERILTAKEVMLDWNVLSELLVELNIACENLDHEHIRKLLLNAPTGFNPTDGICDLVWGQHKPSEAVDNSNVSVFKKTVS